jgi:hypothetical protein
MARTVSLGDTAQTSFRALAGIILPVIEHVFGDVNPKKTMGKLAMAVIFKKVFFIDQPFSRFIISGISAAALSKAILMPKNFL